MNTWPLTNVISLQDWSVYQDLYLALSERYRALGKRFFPQQSPEMEYGTITGATGSTLTTSVSRLVGTGLYGWWNVNRADSANPLWPYPGDWDIVFVNGDGKPWECWRTRITAVGNTSLDIDLATFQAIYPQVATRVLDSNGVPIPGVFTILSGHVQHCWKGYYVNMVVGGIATTATVADSGDSLITLTDSTILVDDATTVSFSLISSTTDLIGKAYQVVWKYGQTSMERWMEWPYNPKGAKTYNPAGPGMFSWYRGYQKSFYTKRPDRTPEDYYQTAGPVSWIFRGYSVAPYAGGPRLYVNPDCQDIDVWSPDWFSSDNQARNIVSPYGKNFSPDLYKTIRGFQVGLMELCPNFVAGFTQGASIPMIFPADIMAVGSSILPGVTALPGQQIHYTYTTPTGKGGSTLTMGQGERSPIVADANGLWTPPVITDAEFTFRRGFTKKWPRQFRYMYKRTGFIPWQSGDTGEIAAVPSPVLDASNNPKVGTWISREASTKYLDGQTFVADELAWYLGTTWDDTYWPSSVVPNLIRFPLSTTGGPDPMMTYYGNFDEKQYVPVIAAPSGTAIAGGIGWLQTASTGGWAGDNYTHTGTATGGATDGTTLIDTAQASNPFWNVATGRFLDFVVEVETSPEVVEVIAGVTVTTPAVWESRVISGFTGTTLTFAALSVTASDKPYKIREPVCNQRCGLNTWQGRSIVVTKPDGTELTGVVAHSNDKFFWFTGIAEPIVADWKWQIVNRTPGTVWAWASGWVSPTGIDPRTGRNQPADTTRIEPTCVSNFGLFSNHDYVGIWLLNEIAAALPALRITIGAGYWVCDSYATANKGNSYGVGDNGDGNTSSFATMDAESMAAYNSKWEESYTDDNITRGTVLAKSSGSSTVTSTVHDGFRHPSDSPNAHSSCVGYVNALGGSGPSPVFSSSNGMGVMRSTNSVEATVMVGTSALLSGSADVTVNIVKIDAAAVFDSFGLQDVDGRGIAEGWARIATLPVTTTEPHYSAMLGARPQVLPLPPVLASEWVRDSYGNWTRTSYLDGRWRGYRMSEMVTLITWEMTRMV